MTQPSNSDELRELMGSAKFAFGLRQQGHLPTVERMLSERASWQEIGREIGWDPATAREWYEREREADAKSRERSS